MSNTLPPTLTIQDVMQYLRISKPTVDRMISAGKIKSFKIGRLRRIKLEALLDYEAGQIAAGGDTQ